MISLRPHPGSPPSPQPTLPFPASSSSRSHFPHLSEPSISRSQEKHFENSDATSCENCSRCYSTVRFCVSIFVVQMTLTTSSAISHEQNFIANILPTYLTFCQHFQTFWPTKNMSKKCQNISYFFSFRLNLTFLTFTFAAFSSSFFRTSHKPPHFPSSSPTQQPFL